MALRVVARIRPQHEEESEKDIVVSTGSNHAASTRPNLVQIPNPKNHKEAFSFQLSNVYDSKASQQDIFDDEISPTIKLLFGGSDVTIFAYGSTGTGKTHTMRGGKTMTDRGIIPRLLSGIYRRARKTVKESKGETKVEISLSYYEIYNDKVFDLFETQGMRTTAGLALRDNGAKAVVVGLTERPCETLKDFERLYDKANINRSTSTTKLNAASSRSHAILGIKVTNISGDDVRVSVASAIDLAGSEDNRRTENGKERLVESASINKSLFTLAKCVEAISQNHSRIPYRESKMTRILSLGQNNSLTIMILNLAPTSASYQDTFNSLIFANRAKKIEIRDIENESISKSCSRVMPRTTQREPLRPLADSVHNIAVSLPRACTNESKTKQGEKSKAFAVYSDRATSSDATIQSHPTDSTERSSIKRSFPSSSFASRPPKRRSRERLLMGSQPTMSKQAIEDIIERKVTDILAAKALDQTSITPQVEISEEVKRRLEVVEQRIQSTTEGREEGLTLLLCAKQHAARGEDRSALKMLTLAKCHFPGNRKLEQKIESTRKKLQLKDHEAYQCQQEAVTDDSNGSFYQAKGCKWIDDPVSEYDRQTVSDDAVQLKVQTAKPAKADTFHSTSDLFAPARPQSPGTKRVLDIINTRDIAKIRRLRGVGLKTAMGIVEGLCRAEKEETLPMLDSLAQLSQLKGVGMRMVEKMRASVE